MTSHELMARVGSIIEEARTAVLATTDEEGRPHVRWMTPAVLPGRPNAVYAVTSRRFAKVAQLAAQPRVEWMFQTRALDTIVTLRGTVNVLDTPSIRSEVFESVARRLTAFWKANDDERDLLVLETVVEEGIHYRSMAGTRETVRFGGSR